MTTQFGARPLKRAIQELFLDPLALKLLAGNSDPVIKSKPPTDGADLVLQKNKGWLGLPEHEPKNWSADLGPPRRWP